MLYLIHGDQQDASRTKLTELKNTAKGKEVRELIGKSLDATMLTQALESGALFGGDLLVVIEGYLTTAKKKEKSFGTALRQLSEAGKSIDIILYEGKEIDKTTVAKLGTNAKVWLYKTPVVIFQFLDSVRPGNTKTTLSYLRQVLTSEPAEIVFALLVRRLRQLLQVRDGIMPEGLQSWQAGRLTSQARHFTIDKLVAMHTKLLDIDIAIKTGRTPFTLTLQLEQLIIQL